MFNQLPYWIPRRIAQAITAFSIIALAHASLAHAWPAAQAKDDELESRIRQLQAEFASLQNSDEQGAMEKLGLLIPLQEKLLQNSVERQSDVTILRVQVRSLAKSAVWLAGSLEKGGEFQKAAECWGRLAEASRAALGEASSEYWDASQEATALQCMDATDDARAMAGQLLTRRASLKKATAQRDLASAQNLAVEDYSLCSVLFGKQHPRTLSSLEFAARIAYSRKDVDTAIEYANTVYSERKKVMPEWHPILSKTALNTGAFHEAAGQFGKANQLYCQLPNGIRKWSCFVRLAKKFKTGGDFATAIEIYEQVLSVGIEDLGNGHPLVGLAATNLGDLYRIQAKYDLASTTLVSAREIWMRAGNALELANCLNSLGLVQQALFDYDSAEASYQSALKQLASSQSTSSKLLKLTISSNQASLLEDLGRFPEARSIYEDLLQEPPTAKTVASLRPIQESLATLYQTVGELPKAAELLETLLQPANTLPPLELARLRSLRGRLFLQVGAFTSASEDLTTALRILDSTPQATSDARASILSLQALLHLKQGDFSDALQLYHEVLASYEQVFGAEHPRCAEIHDQIAKVLRGQRLFKQALDAHSRAITIYEATYGNRNATVAWSFHRQGTTYFLAGQSKRAFEAWEHAFAIKSYICQQVLPWLPEAQAAAFLTSLTADDSSGGRDAVLSVLREDQGKNVELALDFVWSSRGLVLDVIANRQRQLLSLHGDNEDVQNLTVVRKQLAELNLTSTVADSKQRLARQTRLQELTATKEQLERQLSELTRNETPEVSLGPEYLLAKLPPNSVVIQFVRTQKWLGHEQSDSEIDKVPNYDAFLLASDTDGNDIRADWIDLGAAKPIDEAIAKWRSQLIEQSRFDRGIRLRKKSTTAKPSDQARQLIYKQIWRPLLTKCGNAKQVIVIPDGKIHLIPWAALPGEQTRFLVEETQVSTATDGRQLAALLSASEHQREQGHAERRHAEQANSDPHTLLVGGIDYDANLQSSITGGTTIERPHAWSFLPGTKTEVDSIASVFNSGIGIRTLTGAQATEESIKRELQQCTTVHLATHGFFADDAESEVKLQSNSRGEQSHAFISTVATRNPLLLCGLALAGCNSPLRLDAEGLPIEEAEDGYLTAEELMALDLRRVSLCVLSACETGLGRIANDEGVFGLQRALHLSGVKTTIASQWKVDDAATKYLMIEFYKELQAGQKSTAQALRSAQIRILRHFDPDRGVMSDDAINKATPYFWAPFTLCGVPG